MRSCFQVEVTSEQLNYAKQLVEYSIKNHPIQNIWDHDEASRNNTYKYRLIGSLGEVVFADTYGYNRHKRSFGAIDGQDNGNDFTVTISDIEYNIDLKSMQRKSDVFRGYYVLNIPAYQLHKVESETDFYYCISFHEKENKYFASFLGMISKKDIISGKVGILYTKGTERIRADKTTFIFLEDTYEIDFKDFIKPEIKAELENLNGFKLIKID